MKLALDAHSLGETITKCRDGHMSILPTRKDHGPAACSCKRGEDSCKANSSSFTYKRKDRGLDSPYQEAHKRIYITLGNNEGAQKFQVVIIATQGLMEASVSCYPRHKGRHSTDHLLRKRLGKVHQFFLPQGVQFPEYHLGYAIRLKISESSHFSQ